MFLVAGMPKGFHRKRRKAGLLFSSKKQLEKLRMVRRLQKAKSDDMSSIIRTLSYENHEVGHFQYGDNSMQNNETMDIVKVDCMNGIEEDGGESSPATNAISPTNTKWVSSCICC